MSLAVREVSVEKGYDPRDFALVASGGAGPLHVCAIARELHIPKVIVPLFPSHFSALGMLLADERHDFIRTFYCDLASLDFAALAAVHDEMAARRRRACATPRNAACQIELDLRYVGQEFTLSVPVVARRDQARRPAEHPRRVRCALRASLLRTIRRTSRWRWSISASPPSASAPKLRFPRLGPARRREASTRREVYLGDPRKPVSCPVYQRADLGAGARIAGPALIEEHGTTTVLFAAMTAARSRRPAN